MTRHGSCPRYVVASPCTAIDTLSNHRHTRTVGIHGGHTGVFGGEHAVGGEHALVGGQTLGGQAFGGHSFDSGLLADGRHDLGDGIFVGDGSIAGNHLMYGRVPRFGRGGVFLGYDYPDPSLCYQYPEYDNPAAGCYGLYPAG